MVENSYTPPIKLVYAIAPISIVTLLNFVLS